MRRLVIAGHSLGAMRAAVLAGIAAKAGKAPSLSIGFGEPRPGYSQLASLLKDHGVAALPICTGDSHGHDLVTDVPWTLPDLAYCHSGSLIHADATPQENFLHVFRYHYMSIYQTAQLPVEARPVAVMCAEIYKPNGGNLAWTKYFDDKAMHGICYGIYENSDTDYIIFRGSQSLTDWFRDFDHFALPLNDPDLGPVHPGAIVGMRDVWKNVSGILYP